MVLLQFQRIKWKNETVANGPASREIIDPGWIAERFRLIYSSFFVFPMNDQREEKGASTLAIFSRRLCGRWWWDVEPIPWQFQSFSFYWNGKNSCAKALCFFKWFSLMRHSHCSVRIILKFRNFSTWRSHEKVHCDGCFRTEARRFGRKRTTSYRPLLQWRSDSSNWLECDALSRSIRQPLNPFWLSAVFPPERTECMNFIKMEADAHRHLSAGGTTWSYPPACLFPYKENQAINQSAR